MLIYSDRIRSMLLNRRTHWDTAEREAREAIIKALTPRQLEGWKSGKLRTTSQRMEWLSDRYDMTVIESRAAHSAYNAYLDRMPGSDGQGDLARLS